MDILIAFGVILLASLVQASFQLGVSMVTLLSNHATGKRLSGPKVLRLVGSFLLGSLIMTTLLVSTISYAGSNLFADGIPVEIWESAALVLTLVAFGVWMFYYRRGDGTSLWLPRNLAKFLLERIQATNMSAEAFSLGITSVIAEIVFLITPIVTATLAIISLPAAWQLLGIIAYVLVASLGLIIVCVLIGSGHKLSQIQSWRQSNKRFLQVMAGLGLLILGGFIYANQIAAIAPTVGPV